MMTAMPAKRGMVMNLLYRKYGRTFSLFSKRQERELRALDIEILGIKFDFLAEYNDTRLNTMREF